MAAPGYGRASFVAPSLNMHVSKASAEGLPGLLEHMAKPTATLTWLSMDRLVLALRMAKNEKRLTKGQVSTLTTILTKAYVKNQLTEDMIGLVTSIVSVLVDWNVDLIQVGFPTAWGDCSAMIALFYTLTGDWDMSTACWLWKPLHQTLMMTNALPERRLEASEVMGQVLEYFPNGIMPAFADRNREELSEMSAALVQMGYYPLQEKCVMCLEYIFRTCQSDEALLKDWFPYKKMKHAKFPHTTANLAQDCRLFLNYLNLSALSNRTVFTYICNCFFLGDLELHPYKPVNRNWWVDINVGTHSLGVSVQRPEPGNPDLTGYDEKQDLELSCRWVRRVKVLAPKSRRGPLLEFDMAVDAMYLLGRELPKVLSRKPKGHMIHILLGGTRGAPENGGGDEGEEEWSYEAFDVLLSALRSMFEQRAVVPEVVYDDNELPSREWCAVEERITILADTLGLHH